MTGKDFESEVLRINQRYNVEFIEAFGLCPYARPARLAGTSTCYVVDLCEPDIERGWECMAPQLRHASVEVIQFVFPRLALNSRAFQEFANAMSQRAQQAALTSRPEFVVASFHPELPYSRESSARLVPFFRRSPDLLLQFVRLSMLEALKERHPHGSVFFDGSARAWDMLLTARSKSVTDQITDDNFTKAQAGLFAEMQAVLDAITTDRCVSYSNYLKFENQR